MKSVKEMNSVPKLGTIGISERVARKIKALQYIFFRTALLKTILMFTWCFMLQ